MWNDKGVSAISHIGRKVLEAFEIPQLPDESFRMWIMVGSDLVIVKTAIHNILVFSICPKYTKAL